MQKSKIAEWAYTNHFLNDAGSLIMCDMAWRIKRESLANYFAEEKAGNCYLLVVHLLA